MPHHIKGSINSFEEKEYFLDEITSNNMEAIEIYWEIMLQNYSIGVLSNLITKVIFYFLAQKNTTGDWRQIVLIFIANAAVCIIALLAAKYKFCHKYSEPLYYTLLIFINSLLSYYYLIIALTDRHIHGMPIIYLLAIWPEKNKLFIVFLVHSLIILLLKGVYSGYITIKNFLLPKIEELFYYLEKAFYETEELNRCIINQFIRNILSPVILTCLLLIFNRKKSAKIYASKTFFFLNILGYILISILFILSVEFGVNQVFAIEKTPQWIYLLVLQALQAILFYLCSSIFSKNLDEIVSALIGSVVIFVVINFILKTLCDMLGILTTTEAIHLEGEDYEKLDDEWEEESLYENTIF